MHSSRTLRLITGICLALATSLLAWTARAGDGPAAATDCARAPLLSEQETQLSHLTKSARIIPELRDGKATGLRLYSIRADSTLFRLGVRNGDVLRQIAGVAADSPAQLIEAHSRMKQQACPSLTVERDGKPVELRFRLR